MGTYSVCIPWRPQPDRQRIFECVKRWWEKQGFIEGESMFIGDEVMDSHDVLPFSLAAARNQVVRMAEFDDVIILADADTVPEIKVVEEAVEIAMEPGHVIYPFNEYRYLDRKDASLDMGGIHAARPIWTKGNSVGGILVANRKTYWDLGGMDERFERTWGWEDNAFVAVADTLAKVIRLPGKVYSFSHEVEGLGRDWSKLNPNTWRNELYDFAYGKPKVMRELLKGQPGYVPPDKR